MNKSLNLLVWQGDNSEYFCEFVCGKDYETAGISINLVKQKTVLPRQLKFGLMKIRLGRLNTSLYFREVI